MEEENKEIENNEEIDLENDPRVKEHVKGLKNKVSELLNKINSVKPQEKEFTDEELKELRELKKKLSESNEDPNKSKINDVESQYKKLLEKEKQNVEEKEKVINEFRTKEKETILYKEIEKRAITETRKLKDVELEDQKEIIKLKFETDENGNIVSKDNKINDQGERYNLDDYFNDLAKRKAYIFDQIPSGSGTKSTKASGSKIDNAKKLNIYEAAALLDEDPEMYEEIKKKGLLPF